MSDDDVLRYITVSKPFPPPLWPSEPPLFFFGVLGGTGGGTFCLVDAVLSDLSWLRTAGKEDGCWGGGAAAGGGGGEVADEDELISCCWAFPPLPLAVPSSSRSLCSRCSRSFAAFSAAIICRNMEAPGGLSDEDVGTSAPATKQQPYPNVWQSSLERNKQRR